jgi:type IV pilus assembly protein PilY1
MKNFLKNNVANKINTYFRLKPLTIVSLSTIASLACLSSASQATDLQIYAKPEGGQTTILLMLDNSGSMVSNKDGFTKTRLQRLKDGVNDLLTRDIVTLRDGTQVDLRNAYVGLGIFTDGATNHNGLIKVAAAKLNSASTLTTSGSQRAKLKAAVNAMSGNSWTPSANAYAEAAAYMLGSTTYWEKQVPYDIAVESYRLVRKYSTNYSSSNRRYRYTYTYQYSKCNTFNSTNFAAGVQTCASWGSSSNSSYTEPSYSATSAYDPQWDGQPNIPSYNSTNPSFINNPNSGSNQTITYFVNGTQIYTTTVDSRKTGTPAAKNVSDSTNILVNTSTSDVNLRYKSPLPEKSVSCDGQGIYFLSDGLPNYSTNDVTEGVMSAALTDTYSTGVNAFACPISGNDNLPNTIGDGNAEMSGWNCMGELARRLFDSEKNPKKVSINTAFVGFGSAFSQLSGDAKYACKLGSKLKGDRCSTDASDQSLRNPEKGFGNGGYYYVLSDAEVTESIARFIKDNTKTIIDPLPTGAISVPVDALNPNGFQPYGYLRALEPNPNGRTSVWAGNLKKYNILTSGTSSGALADSKNNLIFDAKGEFSQTTYDLWNKTNLPDGGAVNQGGVYWNLPLPTNKVNAQAAIYSSDNVLISRAIPEITAAPDALRRLFTDVERVSGNSLIAKTSGDLLPIPSNIVDSGTNGTYVLDKFKNQMVLKDFPVLLKRKLLNFLGYELSINENETTLPNSLDIPVKPYVSLGGSIHSYPVQLTYSGDLDVNGDLTSIRKQSVLLGSMEGGLHIIDAQTGNEQMVFVPSEILKDEEKSKALKPQSDSAISYGVSGAWVADTGYRFKQSSGATTASTVEANKMNVYGGMRMGGKSYYGLDVIDPKNPKLLFRVGADLADFSRMGQSWSKPLLANIRYDGKITRVMIVGGGYDMCYENPRFKFNTTNPDEYGGGCNKTVAEGNAVYIIDATTGKRLWWVSNANADTVQSNMVHSIVSRISTIDRDGDGLVDHLYFGDLGGQLFRVDLNNKSNTGSSNLGVRAVRLANLATTESGVTITNGDQPRFYQPPTLTIHDEGLNTFILAAIASGDRSTPLDVSPTDGREGMLPMVKLTNRPSNKVFGVIDRDFIEKTLISDGTLALKTKDITLGSLQKNPQTVSVTGKVSSLFFPYSQTGKQGWYRSLSSDYTGNDISVRTLGGIKAFEEEPIALKNNLFIPVYDPEGTGVKKQSDCSPRIIGESNSQLYCLPYGACLDTTGNKDSIMERKTGFQHTTDSNNQLINSNVIGSGIRGITLGPGGDTGKPDSCGSLTMLGNIQGSGKWECTRILNPIRWYEKYVSAS